MSAPICPNCGRANPGGNAADAINAFLWRFFGILFLLFVISSMARDYKESTRDELSVKFDSLAEQTQQNLEKLEKTTSRK